MCIIKAAGHRLGRADPEEARRPGGYDSPTIIGPQV